MKGLYFEPVAAEDFETLFALRSEAMRESLERLSRHDSQRSRERFTAVFAPEHMRHIVFEGRRVGFVTVKPKGGGLHVDHLYVGDGMRGLGVGTWVLDLTKQEAAALKCDLTLSALKLSDANRFYQRHGFVQVGEEEFDVHYRWSVPQ